MSEGVVILWDADYASRVDNFRIRRNSGAGRQQIS
jgi:hypothetical protein